jgi:hypothetical protein
MQEARMAGIEPVRLGLTAASPAAVAPEMAGCGQNDAIDPLWRSR